MATKTKKTTKSATTEMAAEMPKLEASKKRSPYGKIATFGWLMLLLGGLGHMLPGQMAPVLNWAVWGVTLQTAVGVLSVIVALYYLLEE